MHEKEVIRLKTHEMEADLYCIQCKEEVPHVIQYINDEISNITCRECSRAIEIDVDIMNEFYGEIYKRIATKPSRITKEYREDLSHFFFSLPIRIISKPYRLIKDMNETQKVIRRYKK
ncbi:bh protein [Salibacterium aidingense]|uniref:bh protein n=1 Tax=Salibacterium aidingense TaxID=384933 RepID=UPI0004147EF4|nr:bh protein [Salibacterium aidingense]